MPFSIPVRLDPPDSALDIGNFSADIPKINKIFFLKIEI